MGGSRWGSVRKLRLPVPSALPRSTWRAGAPQDGTTLGAVEAGASAPVVGVSSVRTRPPPVRAGGDNEPADFTAR
jgi:hypothetical protein